MRRTLDSLRRQERTDFDVIIVDQSERTDRALERWAAADARLVFIRDNGRGLSRARNVGWRTAESEWVAFVDDDCQLDPDWTSELRTAIVRHPEACFVSGDVRPDVVRPRDHLLVSLPRVADERVICGPRTPPFKIGMGVCMAIRRQALVQLGGFDERFGAGVLPFPAAEDTDFNYRFLRAGGVAYVTPKMRAVHEQWRSPGEAISLYGGYSRAWAAFAMKHARTGDVGGGLWLWLMGLRFVAGMLRSAVRLSSAFRARVAVAMLLGYLAGTVKGALRRW